jgi:hypothetical protein
MYVKKRDHSDSGRDIELNIVCKTNQHGGASKRKVAGFCSVPFEEVGEDA